MSAKQSVTLNDVAREAGVSVATVSRVLNQKARADAQTREKIFKAVETLGYDDSAIVRKVSEKISALRMELKAELLLCPMPEQKNLLQLDFMAEILRGIQSYFNRHRNVTLNISTWKPEADREEKRLLLRRLNSVSGVIIMGSPDETLMNFLQRNAVHYVLLPNDLPDKSVNSISSDDFSGGFRAAEYLIQKGFRKIGFLCGSSLAPSHTMRKYGVMAATVERLGIEAFESRNARTSDDTDIEQCFIDWFDSGKCPPVLVTSHAKAAEVICRILEARGKSCPQDLSLITFDSEVRLNSGVRISYFRTFPRELGRRGAQQLYQLMTVSHPGDKVCKTLVPLDFQEGNSVRDSEETMNCR